MRKISHARFLSNPGANSAYTRRHLYSYTHAPQQEKKKKRGTPYRVTDPEQTKRPFAAVVQVGTSSTASRVRLSSGGSGLSSAPLADDCRRDIQIPRPQRVEALGSRFSIIIHRIFHSHQVCESIINEQG